MPKGRVSDPKVCRICGHDATNFHIHPQYSGLLKCGYCGLLIRADEKHRLPTYSEWAHRREGLVP